MMKIFVVLVALVAFAQSLDVKDVAAVDVVKADAEVDGDVVKADVGVDAGVVNANVDVDAGVVKTDVDVDADVTNANVGVDAGVVEADVDVDLDAVDPVQGVVDVEGDAVDAVKSDAVADVDVDVDVDGQDVDGGEKSRSSLFDFLSSSSSSDSSSSEEVDCRTGPTCINSCDGQANGDYQSCSDCHVYTSCSNGLTYDNRPCPAGLVWDDGMKRCEWTSNTCSDLPAECSGEPPAGDCDNTGRRCISSCDGVRSGNYQSCRRCDGYVSCFHGNMVERDCAPSTGFPLAWDDVRKRCVFKSLTCRCN